MNWRGYLIAVCLSILLIQRIVTPAPGPVVPPVVVDPPVVIPDIPVFVPVEGKRIAIIIRETEDESAAFARLVVQLRSGANAQYIDSKDHELYVYDQHQKDENGEPLELVQQLLPLNSNLPALFILDGSDGRPLHNETLAATATAADVMRILQANGG